MRSVAGVSRDDSFLVLFKLEIVFSVFGVGQSDFFERRQGFSDIFVYLHFSRLFNRLSERMAV